MTEGRAERLKIASGVLFQQLGDEAVLLQTRRECYFGLNAVGVRIWELIPELGHAAAIRERLEGEYDVAPERLGADIERLLGELREAGLVEPG